MSNNYGNYSHSLYGEPAYQHDRSRSNVYSQSRSYEYQHHHHKPPYARVAPPQSSLDSSSLPKYKKYSDYKYEESSSSSYSAGPAKTSDAGKKESNSLEMDGIIDDIMLKLKSKGIFDRFRKECMADIDTKPAYINLNTRVKHLVDSFLRKQKWAPNISKVKIRESMSKYVSAARYFDSGVDSIVDQVVNPKINTIFYPMVEEEVYNCLGIEKPKEAVEENDDVNIDDDTHEDMDINDEEKEKTADLPDQKLISESHAKKSKEIPEEEIRMELSSNFNFPSSRKSYPVHQTDVVTPPRPRHFSEEEPLPPGEEPTPAPPQIDSENSKDYGSPFDYGMAHTPEEEYDETKIREKESQYFKSERETTPPNTKEGSDTDGELMINEDEEEANNDEDYEYDDEDVEEEEEEEESPPFEKIGESPPPSPRKSMLNSGDSAGNSKKNLPENSPEPEVCDPAPVTEDAKETPPETPSDDSEDLVMDKVDEKEPETSPSPDASDSCHIPEDVEDTPVYFLEPCPSLAEKIKFYQKFRERHPEDEDKEQKSPK